MTCPMAPFRSSWQHQELLRGKKERFIRVMYVTMIRFTPLGLMPLLQWCTGWATVSKFPDALPTCSAASSTAAESFSSLKQTRYHR